MVSGHDAGRRAVARMLALSPFAPFLLDADTLPRGPALPPPPAAPDERYWTAVKEQFAIAPRVAVMNAANLCPSPVGVLEAMFNATDLDHDHSPANRTRMHGAKEASRKALAEMLGVSEDEVVLTRNTSESNNLVSSGLDLGPGDDVVLFSDNHASNLQAWQEKSRRWKYTVTVIPQPHPHPGPGHYVDALARALTPRTRLVGLTHLTNTVGDLFPARELCTLAHERGALSLVDGAQSLGLMEVDLRALGADFYSGSAHKWLCGPKEVGILYVRREVQPRLWPSIVSLYPGAAGLAKTFEGFGQRDEPAFFGLTEAVRFQQTIGRARIEARARELARALAEGLRRIDGVTLWTHPEATRSHAIVAFQPGGLDPRRLAESLYATDGIVCAVRSGPDRPGLRLSPHMYTLHAEVDRALAAVRREIRSGGG